MAAEAVVDVVRRSLPLIPVFVFMCAPSPALPAPPLYPAARRPTLVSRAPFCPSQ